MRHTGPFASLDVTSLRAVGQLGEEVLMDEKDADGAAGPAATQGGAGLPPDPDPIAPDPAGSATTQSAAGLPPDPTATDPATTVPAVADELPAGSTVPAGYVAVPAG